MVLRKNVHYICEETEELDDTERGEGGFGSNELGTNGFGWLNRN